MAGSVAVLCALLRTQALIVLKIGAADVFFRRRLMTVCYPPRACVVANFLLLLLLFCLFFEGWVRGCNVNIDKVKDLFFACLFIPGINFPDRDRQS